MRLCTESGCREIVESGNRCSEHQLAYTPKKVYHDHHYHKNKYIYHTPEWKRLRKAQLNLEPMCEMCEKIGLVTPANTVDHIIEISDGGEKFDIDNLASMCRACHQIKTHKEAKKRRKKASQNGFRSLSDF